MWDSWGPHFIVGRDRSGAAHAGCSEDDCAARPVVSTVAASTYVLRHSLSQLRLQTETLRRSSHAKESTSPIRHIRAWSPTTPPTAAAPGPGSVRLSDSHASRNRRMRELRRPNCKNSHGIDSEGTKDQTTRRCEARFYATPITKWRKVRKSAPMVNRTEPTSQMLTMIP